MLCGSTNCGAVLQVPTHIVDFALLFPVAAWAGNDIAEKKINKEATAAKYNRWLPEKLQERRNDDLYDMINCFLRKLKSKDFV
jgi:hypothetical protein